MDEEIILPNEQIIQIRGIIRPRIRRKEFIHGQKLASFKNHSIFHVNRVCIEQNNSVLVEKRLRVGRCPKSARGRRDHGVAHLLLLHIRLNALPVHLTLLQFQNSSRKT